MKIRPATAAAGNVNSTVAIPPAGISSDRKLAAAWLKLQKREQDRRDLQRVIQFIQDNPWIQVLGALVIVDFLRYAGFISKSKSSDIAVVVAGLGVSMNGGSLTETAIASLVGGAMMFFPDTPAPKPATSLPLIPGGPGGPPSIFNPNPGPIVV